MSAADKLAQVIAEHSRTAWNRDGDDKVTGIVCAECQHVYEEWPPNRSTVCAHVAAVVLAHLTAEGWAQGREEWGYGATGGYDGTYVRQTSNEAEARDRAQINDCGVFRRRVTDWEPVEGERRG